MLKRMEQKAGERKRSGGTEKGEHGVARAAVTDRHNPCSHSHRVYCLIFPGV